MTVRKRCVSFFVRVFCVIRRSKVIARKDVKIPKEIEDKMDKYSDKMMLLYEALQKYDNLERKSFGRVWVFVQK